MRLQRHNIISLLLITATLVGLLGFGSSRPVAAQDASVTFPQTGKTLRGGFLGYWQNNGGLAQQGYPITDEFPEVSATDGRTYTTQYFERARFEFHPENSDPRFHVLLGLVGREALQARYPGGLGQISPVTVPGGGSLAFAQTGQVVTGAFLQYWQANGGLAQEGYPITPAFNEVSATDGKTYITQYFERARFEYHPESADPRFRVLLGLLGTEAFQRRQGGGPPLAPTATPLPQQRGITRFEVATNIAAGREDSPRAACPNNSVVISGGWSGNSGNLNILASVKDGNGWRITARNYDGNTQRVVSYALCLIGYANADSTQEEASVRLGGNQSERAFVDCERGVLTGGGFRKEIDTRLDQMQPARGGWLVSGFNGGGGAATLTAYAVCLNINNVNFPSTSVIGQVGLTNNRSGQAVAECPADTRISGGGFETVAGVIAYTSTSSGSNGWQTVGFNKTGGSQTLTSYAVCVKLP